MIINDRSIPRKLFSRRSCDWQFRPIVWHRHDRCPRADIAAQLVAWRPFMALDQWNRSSLSGGGAVLSGDFEAVRGNRVVRSSAAVPSAAQSVHLASREPAGPFPKSSLELL